MCTHVTMCSKYFAAANIIYMFWHCFAALRLLYEQKRGNMSPTNSTPNLPCVLYMR